MADVVREILVCLLLASLLGAAIGWAARGLRNRRLLAGEAAAARQGMEEARAKLRLSDSTLGAEQRKVAELQTEFDAARRQLEALRVELKETLMARDTARHDTAGTKDQLSKLSAQLDEALAARDSATHNLETCRAALTAAKSRTSEVEGHRDAFRRENQELRAAQSATSLPDEATRQHVETLRATLQAAERGWDNARAQAEAAQQQMEATRRQLNQSEVDRAALTKELGAAQTLLEKSRSGVAVAPSSLLEPPSEIVSQKTHRSQAQDERDDLQRIKGIGPALERTLHRAGVYRYAQIANWTRQDIQAMGERLPGFHDRIVRDRWPTAARRLHLAKYGSPP
jgi:predicted flap endonuclease-1-like 5' DNA nuclease